MSTHFDGPMLGTRAGPVVAFAIPFATGPAVTNNKQAECVVYWYSIEHRFSNLYIAVDLQYGISTPNSKLGSRFVLGRIRIASMIITLSLK